VCLYFILPNNLFLSCDFYQSAFNTGISDIPSRRITKITQLRGTLHTWQVISPSQSISGVNAIDPLVAFYDIHGRKREVLFLYYVPKTTRDKNKTMKAAKYTKCQQNLRNRNVLLEIQEAHKFKYSDWLFFHETSFISSLKLFHWAALLS
jgi:hypothetical protein